MVFPTDRPVTDDAYETDADGDRDGCRLRPIPRVLALQLSTVRERVCI